MTTMVTTMLTPYDLDINFHHPVEVDSLSKLNVTWAYENRSRRYETTASQSQFISLVFTNTIYFAKNKLKILYYVQASFELAQC